MSLTVEALKKLYVKLGGDLHKAYPGIAGGVPVSDYTLIPDMINALEQVAESGGGGGGEQTNTPFFIYVDQASLERSDGKPYIKNFGINGYTSGLFDAMGIDPQQEIGYLESNGRTIVFVLNDSSTQDPLATYYGVEAKMLSYQLDFSQGPDRMYIAYALPYEVNGSYIQTFSASLYN